MNAHTHLQYTSFTAVGAAPFPSYVHWADRFLAEYAARRGDDWRSTALDGVAAGLRSGTTCFGDVVTDERGDGRARRRGGRRRRLLRDHRRRRRALGRWCRTARHRGPRPRRRARSTPASACRRTRPTASPSRCCGHRPRWPAGSGSASTPTSPRSTPRTSCTGPARARGPTGSGPATTVAGRSSTAVASAWAPPSTRRRAACSEPTATSPTACTSVAPGGVCWPTAGTIVALCPRSNLTVGIDPPPVADFLREGVPFAVGTDSLGSNASLDLLADVALLRDLAVEGGYDEPDLDDRLVAAATTGGAARAGSRRRRRRPRTRPPGRSRRLGRRPGPAACRRSSPTAPGAARSPIVGGDVRHIA